MHHDARPEPATDLRLTEPDSDHVDALADLFLADAPLGPRGGTAAAAPRPSDTRLHASPTEPAAARSARVERVVLGHLPMMPSAWVHQHARVLAEGLGDPVAVLRLDEREASLDLVGVELDTTPCRSLADAIDRAGQHATRWLVRGADDADVDAVTLLTTGDQAATVAAYRTLKELDEALADTHELGRDRPEMRVVVLDRSIDSARATCERVEAAADAFLSTPIAAEPALAQLTAAPSTVLYDGPRAMRTDDAIEAIRDAVAAVRPPETHRTREPEAEPAETTPNDVASALDLITIDLTCPHAPGVAFAVDSDGGLHAIADAIERGEPTDALVAVLSAEAWARAHASLIARAEPRVSRDAVVAHVLTDRPAAIRDLAGTAVHVHAARRVGDAIIAIPLQ